MKKTILALLSIFVLCGCGTISDPYTFTGGTSAVASQVNARFNTLFNWANGNVESVNIKDNTITSADILNDTIASIDILDDTITHSDIAGIASQPVGETDSQTLTNKTLTSPTITTSPTAAGATWTDLGSVTTADINGGTIDGTTIGATTPAAGTFSDGAMYGQPLIWSKTFVLPEYIQDETDAVPLMPVESGWAPNGILITKCGLKTSASSTYSVVFEDWTTSTAWSSNISTVATSSSTEAESGALTTTVAAGDIVFIDLPTTTGLKWIQLWFVYEIKGS